jgi:beta-N-acetylhexosaminidase
MGDHFMVGLRPGTALDERDRALLRDLQPAGVILYKSNFRHDLPYPAWLKSHEDLISSIREASGRDRQFIAIDHEGGRVCRTPPPITRFSYAALWADSAGEVGAAMGAELAALGFNLNFAPVLDIHSNPENPVIGKRAFGHSAEQVVRSALAFTRAMERNGVRACGKHFPGHGDTELDSHQALPIVDLGIDALKSRELIPFAAAIEGGMGMIMTSHILFKQVDSADPVTLSRPLTNGLLRQELKFNGVIVSDDIGMRAMAGRLDAPDAGAQFMAAGNDMLMICAHWTDTERARGLARSMIEGLDAGRLGASAVAASGRRVRAMLDATVQNPVRKLADDVFKQHRGAGALFDAETVEVV